MSEQDPTASAPATGEKEPSASSPAAHWRRRPKSTPIPREEAVRQGEITQLAFKALGREQAIAFLNADHETLGGRPLAIATSSADGAASVAAEIARLSGSASEPAA